MVQALLRGTQSGELERLREQMQAQGPMAKILLFARKLPLELNCYAWAHGNWLENRRPLRRYNGLSSYERRYAKAVDWRKARPFGCECIVNVPKHESRVNRSQMDPSGEPRICVGLPANQIDLQRGP